MGSTTRAGHREGDAAARTGFERPAHGRLGLLHPTQPEQGQREVVQHRRPRPAPRLERRARPAIFSENKIGTANIGPVAFDAKWSNYGQYLQQLIETVQIQWDRILIQSRVYPASGTIVIVKDAVPNRAQDFAFTSDITGNTSFILNAVVANVTPPARRGAIFGFTAAIAALGGYETGESGKTAWIAG